MTWRRNGLSGSVTQAWRGWVTIGSSMPAIRATVLAHPAVQFTTAFVAISPRDVTTPAISSRPFRPSLIALASVKGWISIPIWSQARA